MAKTTILLIDDNESLRGNTLELLELAGYKVMEAENGIKGLEIIGKQHPDLILCDIMMPELDGYGVLQAVHNIPDMADVPFIFITAKSELKDLRFGMDMGADDYLIKPFVSNELLNIISSRLKKNDKIKEKLKNKLKKPPLFINGNYSFNDIINYSQHKIKKKLMAKQMIYIEGDTVNYIYYLTSGKVKTYKTNADGKEFITELYKEGDIFGHVSFLGESQGESATAIEQSEIIYIPKNEFMQVLNSNAEIALRLFKSSSDYILNATNKMLKLAYDSSRMKVAGALVDYSRKYGDKEHIDFHVVRGDISALAGISKESVSRTLTDFRDEGLIEINHESGNIKIVDSYKLEKLKN